MNQGVQKTLLAKTLLISMSDGGGVILVSISFQIFFAKLFFIYQLLSCEKVEHYQHLPFKYFAKSFSIPTILSEVVYCRLDRDYIF